MTDEELRIAIREMAGQPEIERDRALPLVSGLLEALESGRIRAAEPTAGGWRVQTWVKQGILLGFRAGTDVAFDLPPAFYFRDRDTFPTWNPSESQRHVRIVPGGSSVRRGAFVGTGVVIMPPAFINVGAYVGSGSMIDSHALVGSCAQVGDRVHLSAGAQLGGVLEPVGALPVVVEDDAFVGGACVVFEGTRVGAGAVLAPGVVLTRGVAIFDLLREKVYRADAKTPLSVPAGAIVVPGARPARGEFAAREGLTLQTPVITKYRDPGTDAALALEDALR